MSADVLPFSVFAESSRGLMARVILPNNAVAVRADIASIDYEVYNKTDGGVPVTGALVVADVMYTALQTDWNKDDIGYTFMWGVDGSLWPTPDKRYRVVLIFTIIAPFTAKPELAGKSFIIAYDANTKDPSG